MKLPFDKDEDLYALRLAIATTIYALRHSGRQCYVPSSIELAIKAADELIVKCAKDLPEVH